MLGEVAIMLEMRGTTGRGAECVVGCPVKTGGASWPRWIRSPTEGMVERERKRVDLGLMAGTRPATTSELP